MGEPRKQGPPRPPKQPVIHDFQFYPTGLQALLDKETAAFRKRLEWTKAKEEREKEEEAERKEKEEKGAAAGKADAKDKDSKAEEVRTRCLCGVCVCMCVYQFVLCMYARGITCMLV